MSLDRVISELEEQYSEGVKWEESTQKSLAYIWQESGIEGDERGEILDAALAGNYDQVRTLVEEYGNGEVLS